MCFRQKVGQIITESYKVTIIITFTPSHYSVNHWNLTILVLFYFVYTFTIIHYPSHLNNQAFGQEKSFCKIYSEVSLGNLKATFGNLEAAFGNLKATFGAKSGTYFSKSASYFMQSI